MLSRHPDVTAVCLAKSSNPSPPLHALTTYTHAVTLSPRSSYNSSRYSSSCLFSVLYALRSYFVCLVPPCGRSTAHITLLILILAFRASRSFSRFDWWGLAPYSQIKTPHTVFPSPLKNPENGPRKFCPCMTGATAGSQQ